MNALRAILEGFDRVSVALGLATTVSYGTLFYSFAILAPAIMADFGWSRTFVFGAFSFALLAGALTAPVSGRLLDRFGGRAVMTAGSIVASAALASLWFARTPALFVLGLFLVEGAASLVLYEAAFAALAQIYGTRARARITAVTLIAGFSSTLFWPLTSLLLARFDWHGVYLWLAAITLAVTLPLHASLPGRKALALKPRQGEPDAAPPPVLTRGERRQAIVLLAIAFAASGFAVSAVQSHFPRLFVEAGYTVAAAAGFGAMIGPSQVAARILERVLASRRHPLVAGIAANASLAFGTGLLFLVFAGEAAAIAFAIIYGMGQGLTYIIRGQIPLALFGAGGYGKLTGDLAFIRIAVSAAAPVTVAIISDLFGNIAAITVMTLVAALSALALLPLLAITRKQPSG